MTSLRIFQIWFDEESRKNCFEHPVVTPHFNAVLTPYFENKVILELRPYRERYVGVWSHKAGKKLARAGNGELDLDAIVARCERGGFDVMGFHPRLRRQVIFEHGGRARFDSMFDYLMRRLGVDYDSAKAPRFVVMGNHFIATAEVMNDYCALLARAVDVMESDATLKSELGRWAPYKRDSQIRYTFHPFVCERLFSAHLTVHPEIVCTLYENR